MKYDTRFDPLSNVGIPITCSNFDDQKYTYVPGKAALRYAESRKGMPDLGISSFILKVAGVVCGVFMNLINFFSNMSTTIFSITKK